MVMSLCSGNWSVIVPGGAAPGVIVLQNMKWPGMHIKITKKGKVESVSLCGWEVRVSCGRVPSILSNC